jgi:hypothetical protein
LGSDVASLDHDDAPCTVCVLHETADDMRHAG